MVVTFDDGAYVRDAAVTPVTVNVTDVPLLAMLPLPIPPLFVRAHSPVALVTHVPDADFAVVPSVQVHVPATVATATPPPRWSLTAGAAMARQLLLPEVLVGMAEMYIAVHATVSAVAVAE